MTSDRPIDLGGADVDAVREALEAAVAEANEAISAVRAGKRVRVGHKPGEGPVTEADYAADDILHERLMPLVPGARYDQAKASAAAATPLKAVATPETVADAIYGLIAHQVFVTGQTVIVDGGASL